MSTDLPTILNGDQTLIAPLVAPPPAAEPPPMDPDVILVWLAHREFHPSASAIPSKAAAKEIAAALRAGTTAEQLVAMIQWAHLAPHDRAHFLRGAEYESGTSSVGAYLAVVDLMRRVTLETRVAWAAEWVKAGRPNFRDAVATPSPTAPDPLIPKVIAALEDLVSNNGNPEACADPKAARRTATLCYAIGKSPMDLAKEHGPFQAQAYRAVAEAILRRSAMDRANRVTTNG